jgi:hypothetical protein
MNAKAWMHGARCLVLLIVVSGCGATVGHRLHADTICDLSAGPSQPVPEACASASVEKHAGFDIAYVELTDQGMLQRRAQMDKVRALVEMRNTEPLNIVVFVHGWKHNAAFDDVDVSHFRKIVMPNFHSSAGRARTIGIYVGWRGALWDVNSAIQSATYFDRKGAAEHVARGAVRELFSYLRGVRSASLKPGGPKPVQLTLIGHSFGALIVFNSLAESMFESLIAANQMNSATPRRAEVIADLVLLLNPAFEASRFEPLFQIAKERGVCTAKPWPYDAAQRPLMVSITSAADGATGKFFPIARFVNSLFQHEGVISEDAACPKVPGSGRIEKETNLYTIGHLARYRTHQLTLAGADDRPAQHTPVACKREPNALLQDPNTFPLWNMYTDAEVMNGHHDIYGKNLWQFIAKLYESPQTLATQTCK